MSQLEDCVNEVFVGLSRTAQAVLGFAAILSIRSDHGVVGCSEIIDGLGLSAEEWRAVVPELHDRCLLIVDVAGDVSCAITPSLVAEALGAPGRPKLKDWEALRETVFERSFGEGQPYCLYCSATDTPLVLDHIHPVSRGGSNHALNLVPACVPCNMAKGAKSFAEFYKGRAS